MIISYATAQLLANAGFLDAKTALADCSRYPGLVIRVSLVGSSKPYLYVSSR